VQVQVDALHAIACYQDWEVPADKPSEFGFFASLGKLRVGNGLHVDGYCTGEEVTAVRRQLSTSGCPTYSLFYKENMTIAVGDRRDAGLQQRRSTPRSCSNHNATT
jgi:hypothetical protein